MYTYYFLMVYSFHFLYFCSIEKVIVGSYTSENVSYVSPASSAASSNVLSADEDEMSG